MFKLQRNKTQSSSSGGKKIEFKFSKFLALQVPKGWNELIVSIISVETGKSIVKTNKALVQNGQCQWSDTLSESIWIPSENISKEPEEKALKFVVASVSARSGILGEATLNMKGYMSSSASIPVSLPLKKCVHGTILKVKINCVTPRTKSRNKESETIEDDSVDMKSNGSDNTGARSARFIPKNSLNSVVHPEEPVNRETSSSTSANSQSCDSREGSRGTENFSPRNKINGYGHNLTGAQNSNGLQNGAHHGKNSFKDPYQSNHSLFNSRVSGSDNNSHNYCQDVAQSPASSESLLEAAEDSVGEVQEVETWGRQDNKPAVDPSVSGQQFSDQPENLANMNKDLSAVFVERDGLKKEVERLNVLLEESMVTQTETKSEGKGVAYIREELEKEIKFQRESNSNLAQQLKKSQESNIELVLVLQELEATIEKQKLELEKISDVQLKCSDMELSMQRNLEENQALVLQLHELQESERNLQVKVQLLERAMQDKIHEIENPEETYPPKLSSKREKVSSSEANLSEQSSEETVSVNESNVDLIREIESLKEKVEELERDCNELTDENLELLIKLKESKTSYSRKEGISYDFSSDLLPVKSFLSSEYEEQPEKSLHEEDQVASSGTSAVLGKICKQFQVAFSQLKEPWYKASLCLNSNLDYDFDKFINLNSTDKAVAEFVFRYLVELNKLLEARVANCVEVQKSDEAEIREKEMKIAEAQEELENYMDIEQRLQETQFRLTESQEEYEYLRVENSKLEATSESLVEKCSSLQKLNVELRKHKLELHEHCMELEAELQKLQKNLIDYPRKVEDLEAKISSILVDFASKENWLNSELDAVLLENKKCKEQLGMGESLLNNWHIEKAAEVEGLQREVDHLKEQISTAQDDRDRIASEAMHEVNCLRADNTRLESALQEVQLKVRLTENNLHNDQKESETKVEELMSELGASKKEVENMMADHEKMLNLLENKKLNEEKLKTIIEGLELNLTTTESECQQLSEETANLKAQLQDLKRELSSANFEKDKLGVSQRMLSGYCEELEAEKNAYIEKISALQRAASDLEDCKRTRDSLEEKLMHVEGDLAKREAELKNELSQIKRANEQLQEKTQQLEEEKDEFSQKVEVLREELRLMAEENKSTSGAPKAGSRVASNPEDLKHSKNDMMKSSNQHRETKRKPPVKTGRAQKLPKEQQNLRQSQHLREGNIEYNHHDETSHAVGDELVSKIESLENELAEALELNNMYKVQLNRLVSEGGSRHSDATDKSMIKGKVVPKERYERTKSKLEAELRDIRERYLHMSLKYAEAEAQHEEIVMKLKGAKSVKRWFS